MDADAQARDRPIVKVVGERVALGTFERCLGSNLQRWYNDFQVVRTWFGVPHPRSAADIDAVLDWFGREDRMFFAVYERSTWRAIGFTCLIDIAYPDRPGPSSATCSARPTAADVAMGLKPRSSPSTSPLPRLACTTSICGWLSTTRPGGAHTRRLASARSADVTSASS